MRRLFGTLREHLHVLIVVTVLTLVMTFPTIVYVFKTDVFWHPAGTSHDVYIKFWDIWYGKQFLTGQADPFYTKQVFYPEGLSLAFHPFGLPHIIAVNALKILLPTSNALSLAYLLIVVLCALSAYAYLLWLFKDKWVALFGAVVVGFSPHVVGHPNHPDIAFIATIPAAVYCIHRGIKENRRVLVALAGLLTGLTSTIILYVYVCLLFTLGFIVIALAIARWRDNRFWLNVMLLMAIIALSSYWRVYPLLASSESLASAANWHGHEEIHTDVISYFINHNNPFFDRLFSSISSDVARNKLSSTSYLGYLPLLLISVGMLTTFARRKMAPWAFICAFFLILRLGSHLVVNGAVFDYILLPKYYLNQLLPAVFNSFWEADLFMMGALLPFAVLSCYGLVATQKRYASIAKPRVILALIAIVALEYHIPVRTDRIFPVGDGAISEARFAFLEWLEQEDDEIRLVNLPMGRQQSKIYNLYQSLSGYPHAEGAISRTPDSAFDYIRANLLLNTWHQQQPISCELVEREVYFTALSQLQADGFSHVVYHMDFMDAEAISNSFREVEASFMNEYVQIFRLNDLREGCTNEQSAHYSFTRAYADALAQRSIIDDRPGLVLVFPPTVRAADHFLRYHRHFADIDHTVVTVTSDEQAGIETRLSDINWTISSSELEEYAALWLVNKPLEFDAEQTPAFQDWFIKRFHFCQRFQKDDRAVVNLYLRAGIPCSAIDLSSEMEVQYDSGVRLHNLSYTAGDDELHFYLAWTNTTRDNYAYSIQFFDEDGQKPLQDDKVIYRDLLAVHDIDASSLSAGVYSIQLIVYDFETQVSIGGTLSDGGQRFDRELEIAKIEWKP